MLVEMSQAGEVDIAVLDVRRLTMNLEGQGTIEPGSLYGCGLFASTPGYGAAFIPTTIAQTNSASRRGTMAHSPSPRAQSGGNRPASSPSGTQCSGLRQPPPTQTRIQRKVLVNGRSRSGADFCMCSPLGSWCVSGVSPAT
jgi:hypothetical protein